MKLMKIFIGNFGPFINKDFQFDKNFTLIFGNNEAGKTFLLDAITTILIGNKYVNKGIPKERISGNLSGSMVILHNGEEFNFNTDTKDTLEKKFDWLSNSIFANTFIIRDSNTNFSFGNPENPKEHILQTLENIVGMNKSKIEKIQSNIRKICQLTDKGDLRNTADNAKLKDKVENAQSLINEIEDNKESFEKYDSMEKECLNNKNKLNILKKQLEKMEKIKNKKDCNTLKNLRQERQDSDNFILQYGNIEKDKNNLEETISKRERIISEIKEIEINLSKEKRLVEESKTQKTKLQKEYGKLDKIEKYIEETRLISRWERFNKQKKIYGIISLFHKYMGIFTYIFLGISALLGGISAYFYYKKIFNPDLSGTLLLISSGIFIIGIFSYIAIALTMSVFNYKEQTLEKEFGFISDLYGNDSIAKQLSLLQKIKENVNIEILRLEGIIDEKNTNIKTMENKLREKRDDLEKVKLQINEILKKYDAPNEDKIIKLYDSYIEAQNKKREIEAKITGLLNLENTNNLNKALNERINILEKESNSTNDNEDKEFDEETLLKIRQKTQNLEKEIEKCEKDLSKFYTLKNKIIENAIDILGKRFAGSLGGIFEVKKELYNFVKRTEKQKQAGNLLISILDKIKEEEIDNAKSLFNEKGSVISETFATLTNKKYKQIAFKNEKLSVVTDDSQEIQYMPLSLSGGTYDQMYFSVRVGLAEKLFANQKDKGFFLLDDPFIKYDNTRLKKAFDILDKLINNGWQIIYFSTKEEIKTLTNDKFKDKQYEILDLS